jgi:hypothetical protein
VNDLTVAGARPAAVAIFAIEDDQFIRDRGGARGDRESDNAGADDDNTQGAKKGGGSQGAAWHLALLRSPSTLPRQQD